MNLMPLLIRVFVSVCELILELVRLLAIDGVLNLIFDILRIVVGEKTEAAEVDSGLGDEHNGIVVRSVHVVVVSQVELGEPYPLNGSLVGSSVNEIELGTVASEHFLKRDIVWFLDEFAFERDEAAFVFHCAIQVREFADFVADVDFQLEVVLILSTVLKVADLCKLSLHDDVPSQIFLFQGVKLFLFIILFDDPALVSLIFLVELLALHIRVQRPAKEYGLVIELLSGLLVDEVLALRLVDVRGDEGTFELGWILPFLEKLLVQFFVEIGKAREGHVIVSFGFAPYDHRI